MSCRVRNVRSLLDAIQLLCPRELICRWGCWVGMETFQVWGRLYQKRIPLRRDKLPIVLLADCHWNFTSPRAIDPWSHPCPVPLLDACSMHTCMYTSMHHTWWGPRRRTAKALRCLRSSKRILSSSESGSRGLLYSSSSTSLSEASPACPAWVCVELGSDALFFLHLVRRFWNQTSREKFCHRCHTLSIMAHI